MWASYFLQSHLLYGATHLLSRRTLFFRRRDRSAGAHKAGSLAFCRRKLEVLRVSFGTLAVLHAWEAGVEGSTRSVDHGGRNGRLESGRQLRVGELRADYLVVIVRTTRFVLGSKDEQNVGVGETPLLEFNNV